MGENLVIVESPAKAKTIEKFLGEQYTVKSSFGHIRDLAKKNLGIDTLNDFEPEYIISDEKKKVVAELKAAVKKAKTVWLASDEDREGEAIAWHLQQTLNLNPETTKRIVFHEITKNAILQAIENPRGIDMNLVMAQQARRVLDRLVGFELSPILWKKIKPSLSAGRVQSVALRLIVDREREIMNFKAQPYFKVEGFFHPEGTPARTKIKGSVSHRLTSMNEAQQLLEACSQASFQISRIDKKETSRTPAPPFTTSSLQQEAARKFGFSVSQTMSLAQRLYESGLITYMRTDSTNLSQLAINSAKACIIEQFGEAYSNPRQYKTHSKGAQEAHEAIRPTYIEQENIEGTVAERKLYSLIWKRTVASQMADARLEKTTLTLSSEGVREDFISQAQQVLFDGFLKLYIESNDDETDNDEEDTLLPPLSLHQEMKALEIQATERYTLHPLRYTEASLVKKMEELGIGRPSTYAPTISTLGQRGYILKDDRKGEEHTITQLVLKNGVITSQTRQETFGSEKGKLCPENIGIVVTDFLAFHFPDILDYGFTAHVEESFDAIAAGKQEWVPTIRLFYGPFHKLVEDTTQEAAPTKAERVLGTDPKTGKEVIVRIGRFGPLVQIGTNDDPDKKFASLAKGQLIESISLEEALQLFELPRQLGEWNGMAISASKGRFGPYVKYGTSFVSLGKKYDPYTVTLDEAITLIQEHAEKNAKKEILNFEEAGIQVLNGRYGPYIKQGKNNYKIPKGTSPETLTLSDCQQIIAEADAKGKK